jgi:hypothetical protein
MGEESQKVARRVWDEIVEELARHVPDVKEHL